MSNFDSETQKRKIVSISGVPAGYSLYATGIADDIDNGTFGGGVTLSFTDVNNEKQFQLLNHFYILGSRSVWEGCSINNYFDVKIVASATTGLTNTSGDFNKVQVPGGNLIVPAAEGAGAWDMDLDAKFTNTAILKATPVPVAGGNGWFDYNSDLNVITVNQNQTGGYHLLDFDRDLHYSARHGWGTSIDGGSNELNLLNLVGKLIYNSWKIQFNFNLSGGLLSTNRSNITLLLAVKGNTA